MRLSIIIFSAILLSGCFATGSGLSLGVGDSQAQSNSEHNQVGNGVGEINTNFKSVDGENTEYNNGAMHQSKDNKTSNNTNNDTGQGAKVAGYLKDTSTNINESSSQSKTATDDDNIQGNQIIHNAEKIADKIMRIVENNINAIVVMFAYFLGGYVANKRRDKYREKYEKI